MTPLPNTLVLHKTNRWRTAMVMMVVFDLAMVVVVVATVVVVVVVVWEHRWWSVEADF